MFGAPRIPNLPGFSPAPRDRRRPGVGDHVCLCGGYVGLIVDIRPGGLATVAKRSRSGNSIVETDILVDAGLHVSPITPICANETLDTSWCRGALG